MRSFKSCVMSIGGGGEKKKKKTCLVIHGRCVSCIPSQHTGHVSTPPSVLFIKCSSTTAQHALSVTSRLGGALHVGIEWMSSLSIKT